MQSNRPAACFWTSLLTFAAAFGTIRLLHPLLCPLLIRFSAYFSGIYLGIVPVFHEDAWWIYGTEPALKISEACSGVGFYTLLTSLLIWITLEERPHKNALLSIVLIVGITLPITVLVNSARILISLFLHRLTVPALGAEWGYRFHLLAGVLTFLPTLILLYSLVRWRLSYAQPHETLH